MPSVQGVLLVGNHNTSQDVPGTGYFSNITIYLGAAIDLDSSSIDS